MLETDIRIVRPGTNLIICTRTANLSGPNLTPDLVEKACNALRYRHSLAAVRYPGRSATVIVATQQPIKSIHLEGEDWELDLTDAGEFRRLALNSIEGIQIIPELIERAFLAHLSAVTDYWTLDSPRIWYEPNHFCVEDGIAALYRYEVGTEIIEDVGIGLSVDVSVGFFSVETLAYFFDSNAKPDERKARERTFKRLTQRQDRQKGTLLYDNGRSKVKCYFESAPPGLTCGTTGAIRIKGKSYNSLLDYYRATYPELPVSASTVAVRVSFKGLEHPQPIAADRVRVRVMNENTPESLRDVDKIEADERRKLLMAFWERLGPKPLGDVAEGVAENFWRPTSDRIVQFAMPLLIFGKGQSLPVPESASPANYKEHFRQRLNYLKKNGCYHVPPNITRTLYCVYPDHLKPEMVKQLATDVAKEIHQWTGKPMTAQLVKYGSISDAVQQLRNFEQSGMALFILNEEPSAYYEAEFQLSGWHVKRVTEHTLAEHHRYLTEGAWDRRKHAKTLEAGQRRWSGYVNLIAVNVIQQLEIIPYRIDQAGPYEAQLVIDVGYDRRYFAVSLLLARADNKTPSFRFFIHTQHKVDHSQEGINPQILADEIVAIFSRLPRRFDPIESLLVIRHGRLVRQEPEGVDDGIARIKEKGYLSAKARIDQVDVHKETLKYLRLWDVDDAGRADNPLVGIGVRLNQKKIVVANTGTPTLTQGTADPLLIVSNGRCSDVVDAAQANFAGAQLNWSSPGVVQRLHIGMKRTDEDLKSRSAQEIKRLR